MPRSNVVGLLNVAKVTMPALRAGRDPTLVMVTSNAAGQVVSPQNAIYSASNAAVHALRLEYAGNVRVVEIAPASCATPRSTATIEMRRTGWRSTNASR
ncbi:MAG: SDR family NAD(P)-dependent oxidoreductase [Ilumatobacteraceae bacterium]|nr:SDR family NAD(P)-dependent oxidoreductase [Ilumatobacteraceae bacterium]